MPEPEKKNMWLIVLAWLIALAIVAVIPLLVLQANFMPFSPLLFYVFVSFASIFAGFILYFLIHVSHVHLKGKTIFSIIFSSLVAIASAAATMIVAVMYEIRDLLGDAQTTIVSTDGGISGLLSVFPDEIINPHIYFLILFVLLNVVFFIYFVKQNEYRRMLLYFIPLSIYLVVSMIFLRISSSILSSFLIT